MMNSDTMEMTSDNTNMLEPLECDPTLGQPQPQATNQPQTLLLSGDDEDDDEVELLVEEDQGLNQIQSANQKTVSTTLIQTIISPSPFAHHNDAATADRYRSALQRIHVSPQSDVEAWQAILNECLTLYRSQVLPALEEERQMYRQVLRQHGSSVSSSGTVQPPPPFFRRDESLELQLDWIESCHGHLLQYFPYAANYYVSILDVLLARSAFLFESLSATNSVDTSDEDLLLLSSTSSSNTSTNPNTSHSFWIQNRTAHELYERKMNLIFQQVMGLTVEGRTTSSTTTTTSSATILPSDPLSSSSSLTPTHTTNHVDDEKVLYGASKQSNQILGGMCASCVELWLLYIRKRTRDARRIALQQYLADSLKPPSFTNISSAGEEYIRDIVVDAFEMALKSGAACAINNHLIWKHYLTFVKSWNVIQMTNDGISQIDQNLVQKQRQTLRTIYQRLVTFPMTGLDLYWLEYESFEKAQSEQLATALVAENLPKYQHARSVYLERNRVVNINELRIGRLATTPADLDTVQKGGTGNEGKRNLNQEEYFSKMKDECIMLAKWQRRCAYERTNPERLSPADLCDRVRLVYKEFVSCFMRHVEVWHEWSTWELLSTNGRATTHQKSQNVRNSLTVLALAQHQLPDSTLLAYMEANVMEAHFSGNKLLGPADEDTTTSIEHPSIQAMNKFCNRNPTTLGFVLLQQLVRKYKGKQEARDVFARARRILKVRPEDAFNHLEGDKKEIEGDMGGEDSLINNIDEARQRLGLRNDSKSMVMNRETFLHLNGFVTQSEADAPARQEGDIGNGMITWHLYASHASIEHRLNGAPHIAARIFELGLRRHRTFLSTPQFILQYASLLLELKDEDNLRALLTRAIAACEEDLFSDPEVMNQNISHARQEAQRPLWDMMLKFESVLSPGDVFAVHNIESRRRRALYGPQHEDIAGGDFASYGAEGDIGIGIQKSNLGETLIRLEGYDVCSRISNGTHRLVDSLETNGLWAGSFSLQPHTDLDNPLNSLWKDHDSSSGSSDTSFRRRLIFKEHYRRFSAFPNFGENVSGGTSGKLLSAKERLAQSASQSYMASFMSQTIPEWLRGLVQLLPLNPRVLRGAKAPPHLIEITLNALRDSSLPTERPSDDNNGPDENSNALGSKKRLLSDKQNDSSDEEEVTARAGYSEQFRARQRSRITNSLTTANSI